MPVYKGTKGLIGCYKGDTAISKIYKGSVLMFQSGGGVELPVMEVYVKRYDAENETVGKGPVPGYNFINVQVSVYDLDETVSITYDGITKTFTCVYDEQTSLPRIYDCTFGKVNNVDDGTANEGWIKIESNTPNSTARIWFEGTTTNSNGTAHFCNIYRNTIKGNYMFIGLLGKLGTTYQNDTVGRGYYPTTLIFDGTKIYNSGFNTTQNRTTTSVTISAESKQINDGFLSNSSGQIYTTTLDMTAIGSNHIDIKPGAFTVKTASALNVYMIDNQDVLDFDWSKENSSAKIYNNNVQCAKATAPTLSCTNTGIANDTLTFGSTESNIIGYEIKLPILSNSIINYITRIDTTDSSKTIYIKDLNGGDLVVDGTSYTISCRVFVSGKVSSSSTSVTYKVTTQ